MMNHCNTVLRFWIQFPSIQNLFLSSICLQWILLFFWKSLHPLSNMHELKNFESGGGGGRGVLHSNSVSISLLITVNFRKIQQHAGALTIRRDKLITLVLLWANPLLTCCNDLWQNFGICGVGCLICFARTEGYRI